MLTVTTAAVQVIFIAHTTVVASDFYCTHDSCGGIVISNQLPSRESTYTSEFISIMVHWLYSH